MQTFLGVQTARALELGKADAKMIWIDARTLAWLARIDPQLLSPVQHHSAKGQIHFDTPHRVLPLQRQT